MKREIKFRAWSSAFKKMEFSIGEQIIYPNQRHINTSTDFWITYFRESGWQTIGYSGVIMQYTGLKDKNGVDIYEGDIVKEDGMNLMKVIFQNYACKWMLQETQTESKSYRDISKRYDLNYEVIGNIHENPELLN